MSNKPAKLGLFLLVSACVLALAFGFAPVSAQGVSTATFTPTRTATSTITPTLQAPAQATSTITPTRTSTIMPATATRTSTVSPATATRTSTSAPATATRTFTPVTTSTVTTTVTTPTATRTVVPVTATATLTATRTPTRTVTSTPVKLAPKSVGAVSSLSTMFVVQNTDPSVTANISATFYDTGGTSSGPITSNINPNRNGVIDQRLSGGVPGNPPSFQGSVVLSSNTQLASVVTEFSSQTAGSLGTDFRMDAYTGIASARAATTVILTQLYKDVFDSIQNKRYNSTIAIQNTSLTASTNVTITYYGMASPNYGPYVHSGISIPAGSTKVIDLSDPSSEPNLPTSPADLVFIGSGVVTSDASTPVAVIANHNAAGSLTSQLGLTSIDANTTLYFPQLYRDVYDPLQGYTFGSSIQVMKPDPNDTTPVNVTMTYNNILNGHTSTQTGQLNATMKKLSFDQRYGGVESPFYGSATLVADAPVVATSNIVTNFTSLGGRATTYRAIPGGSGTNTVFIPLLLKRYFDAGSGVYYGTAFQGRTTNGASATITVTYYYTEGGVPKQVTLPAINVTPSHPQFAVEQRDGYDTYLPMGSIASAVVTSTGPIAVTVNMVGINGTPGDGSGTFDGVGQ